jgi:acid phosphatase type 7
MPIFQLRSVYKSKRGLLYYFMRFLMLYRNHLKNWLLAILKILGHKKYTIPLVTEKSAFRAMRKSSRFKDRKELNINLILCSLRSLTSEFLACSKSRFFNHERYKLILRYSRFLSCTNFRTTLANLSKSFCIFTFLILLPSCFFASSIRHLYLTWQRENTSTNITVNIHTINNVDEIDLYYDVESKTNSLLPYKLHKHSKGKHFFKDRYIFHIELEDLIPGKTYYFTLKTSLDSFSEEKKFTTIPSSFESLRLIEGGDWENPSEAIKLCKVAAKYNPQAIILGGDYPDNVYSLEDYLKWDRWLDSYSSNLIPEDGRLIPLILAIGNHDVVGGFNQTCFDAPFYFNYFPQSQYKNESFFLKFFGDDIALFILDSGHCYEYFGEQYNWLKTNLQANRNKPIKIAIYHVPIFPSVRFSDENFSYRLLFPLAKFSYKNLNFSMLLSNQSLQGKKYWLPLFDKYELTAAFEHHDHTLKRTKPIRFGMIHPNGTVYLGDGGWSPKIQYIPIQSYLSTYFAKCLGHVQFFWLIEVTKNKILYRAISQNNEIIDEYVQKIKRGVYTDRN